MTCSECSNQIPEDKTVCPYCGAPAEIISTSEQPRVTSTTTEATTASLSGFAGTVEGQGTLRLWNPVVMCVLTAALMGSAVGSVLVALNWHQLKNRNKAIVAWCFWPCFYVFGFIVPGDFSQQTWSIVFTFVWLAVLGIPQALYFRRHVHPGYSKRGWAIPVVVGLALTLLVTLFNR